MIARRLLALACASLVAVGLPACGGDDGGGGSGGGGGGAPISRDDLPDEAVAAVGDETISEDRLDEQVAALRRAQPSGARLSREQLEPQALSLLLQREWLEQEAEQRGLEVSDADVRRRWDAAIGRQFRSDRALRSFLGDQTEADVLAQLRAQALQERIEQDVHESDGPRALRRFRKRFQRDWQDSTSCREGYTAPGCGSAR